MVNSSRLIRSIGSLDILSDTFFSLISPRPIARFRIVCIVLVLRIFNNSENGMPTRTDINPCMVSGPIVDKNYLVVSIRL